MTTPGRGGYRPAQWAADTAFACRMAAAELFDMTEHPERVIFTSNATHALNLAIKTLVRPGERVVISGYEHNAVTRPLVALGAETLVAQAPLFRPEVLLRQFERAITDRTAAVILYPRIQCVWLCAAGAWHRWHLPGEGSPVRAGCLPVCRSDPHLLQGVGG